MKVLELFAGSRSIGKEADKLGWDVFSSDINNFENIDYVTDIFDFDVKQVPFTPDIIWASPPCTTFSVASIGKHWNPDRTPKSEKAIIGLQILQRTIQLIEYYRVLNPNLIFYIENPRGMMRKMEMLQYYDRHTVTYCQYGDSRMKPTDIWTNNNNFFPKDPCKNGSPCHTPAPRGSSTGTQGLKGNYERSKIPSELCKEVLVSCI